MVSHTDCLVIQRLKRKFVTETENLDKTATCKSANNMILILAN